MADGCQGGYLDGVGVVSTEASGTTELTASVVVSMMGLCMQGVCYLQFRLPRFWQTQQFGGAEVQAYGFLWLQVTVGRVAGVVRVSDIGVVELS